MIGVFFAGIGGPICHALLAHFIGFNMSWSSTNKETVTRLTKLRQIWQIYRIHFSWAFLQVAMIIVGWFVLNLHYWQGILPMAIVACAHFIVPFISAF